MVKRRRPPGQSWKTFLRNQALGISAVDLFVVPTIGSKLLYCLVVLNHGRRVLVHYAVTDRPTALWIAQRIVEAFPWGDVPQYLLRDQNGVYGQVVRRRLRDTMSALDGAAPPEAAGEWPRHQDVEHHHRQRVDDRAGRNIAVVSLRGADLAVDQYRARQLVRVADQN
jgi:hypothetical protein